MGKATKKKQRVILCTEKQWDWIDFLGNGSSMTIYVPLADKGYLTTWFKGIPVVFSEEIFREKKFNCFDARKMGKDLKKWWKFYYKEICMDGVSG